MQIVDLCLPLITWYMIYMILIWVMQGLATRPLSTGSIRHREWRSSYQEHDMSWPGGRLRDYLSPAWAGYATASVMMTWPVCVTSITFTPHLEVSCQNSPSTDLPTPSTPYFSITRRVGRGVACLWLTSLIIVLRSCASVRTHIIEFVLISWLF